VAWHVKRWARHRALSRTHQLWKAVGYQRRLGFSEKEAFLEHHPLAALVLRKHSLRLAIVAHSMKRLCPEVGAFLERHPLPARVPHSHSRHVTTGAHRIRVVEVFFERHPLPAPMPHNHRCHITTVAFRMKR